MGEFNDKYKNGMLPVNFVKYLLVLKPKQYTGIGGVAYQER